MSSSRECTSGQKPPASTLYCKSNWKGRDMVRDHKIIGIESNNQVLNYGIEIKYKNIKTYRKRGKQNKKL